MLDHFSIKRARKIKNVQEGLGTWFSEEEFLLFMHEALSVDPHLKGGYSHVHLCLQHLNGGERDL